MFTEKPAQQKSFCSRMMKFEEKHHLTHMATNKKLQEAATYREAAILYQKGLNFVKFRAKSLRAHFTFKPPKQEVFVLK